MDGIRAQGLYEYHSTVFSGSQIGFSGHNHLDQWKNTFHFLHPWHVSSRCCERNRHLHPEFSVFPLLHMSKVTEKKNSLVFFLAYALLVVFSQWTVWYNVTSFSLSLHLLQILRRQVICPALWKQFGIFGYKTKIEILPVQSAVLLPPSFVRPGVHPTQ